MKERIEWEELKKTDFYELIDFEYLYEKDTVENMNVTVYEQYS